jgi:hypothetical protein
MFNKCSDWSRFFKQKPSDFRTFVGEFFYRAIVMGTCILLKFELNYVTIIQIPIQKACLYDKLKLEGLDSYSNFNDHKRITRSSSVKGFKLYCNIITVILYSIVKGETTGSNLVMKKKISILLIKYIYTLLCNDLFSFFFF